MARLLAVLLIGLAAILAITATASARVGVSLSGGTLTIQGSADADQVTIELLEVAGPPPQSFLRIIDPRGVIDPLPPGCFRADANEIHCNVREINRMVANLGAGNDALKVGRGIVIEVEANGGAGDDVLEGGDGDDVINGGPGNDRISGGPGNDRLNGADGNDRLNGAGGRDRLFGAGGRDRLFGGSGRDRLNGGSGRDRLNGGPGRDRCGRRARGERRSSCP